MTRQAGRTGSKSKHLQCAVSDCSKPAECGIEVVTHKCVNRTLIPQRQGLPFCSRHARFLFKESPERISHFTE